MLPRNSSLREAPNLFLPQVAKTITQDIDWVVEFHVDDDRHASTWKSHASTPHQQPTPTTQESRKHLEPTPTTNTNRPHQKTSAPHHQPTPRSRNQETLRTHINNQHQPTPPQAPPQTGEHRLLRSFIEGVSYVKGTPFMKGVPIMNTHGSIPTGESLKENPYRRIPIGESL